MLSLYSCYSVEENTGFVWWPQNTISDKEITSEEFKPLTGWNMHSLNLLLARDFGLLWEGWGGGP